MKKRAGFLEKYRFAEISRVYSSLGKRRVEFSLALLGCCAAPVASQIAYSLLWKTMIDAAVLGEIRLIWRSCLVAGAAILAGCLVEPLSKYRYSLCVRRGLADLRIRVFGRILRLPMAYHEGRHSGDSLARMNQDFNSTETAFGAQLVTVVVTTGSGMGSALAICLLDWRFALPVFLIGFIYMRTNLLFIGPIRTLSDRVQAMRGRAFQYLGDILEGFKVLRIFDFRSAFARFLGENELSRKTQVARAGIWGLQSMLNHAFGTACYIGMLVVGAFLVAKGKADLGSVMAILGLQQAFNHMLLSLGEYLAQLQESLSGAARVFEVLDSEEEPYEAGTGQTGKEGRAQRGAFGAVLSAAAAKTRAGIEFRDVCFSYESSIPVLRNLSLRIDEGSRIALAGESGSGKSTLVKLLLRFREPESGEIHLGGRNIADMPLEALRSMIAFVPQDAYLFEGTIEENLLAGRPGASRSELIGASEAAYADGFIRELKDGYDTRVGERGFKLSGGQRQRIAIARALLKSSPFLVLDEATSALDSESELFAAEGVERLSRGKTLILIAHRASTIERAETVFVLGEGRLLESGTWGELSRKGGALASLLARGDYGSPEERGAAN